MSFLPKLRFTSSPEKVENVSFYGLNKNENAGEGYFSDTRNMTSRDFPFISSRNGRFLSALPEGFKCLGADSGRELYFILGDGVKSYFYYGGELKGEWEDAQQRGKFFCEVGGAIYIFPDRKFYRMKNENAIEEYIAEHPRYGEVGSGYIRHFSDTAYFENTRSFYTSGMTHEFETGDAIKICAFDKDTGERVPYYDIGLDEHVMLDGPDSFRDIYFYNSRFVPKNKYITGNNEQNVKIEYEFTYPPEYGDEFYSFAEDTSSYRLYRDSEGEQYLLLEDIDKLKKASNLVPASSNFEKELLSYNFADGMTVYFSKSADIESVTVPESAVISECGIRRFYYGDFYRDFVFLKFPKDTFTVKASAWESSEESGFEYIYLYREDDNDKRAYITASPKYPLLSGAVCVNNRLWGYEGSTIYASSLGKPYILGDYSGISTDSWTVEAGIKRDFTGVFAYNSIPHYFTEDRIIKVYGSAPSSFQTSETECAGVKEGSSGSLIICGGILYYLDKDGYIASYTGSYPNVISRNLNEEFESALGVADDRFLYFILESKSGAKRLYKFDTLNSIWIFDDDKDAFGLTYHDGAIYIIRDGFIESSENVYIGFEQYLETGFESILEFPVTDEGLFNMKKLKKVLLKINASEGTSLKIEARETDSPEYRCIFERTIEGGDEVLTVPVDCKRTLGYTVRITAVGKWRLEGIMRRVSIGSYKS